MRRDGPNALPTAPSTPAWRLLAAEMTHFFALMLWVAAGLAFLAGMPQLAVAIVTIIVVNAVFAFLQEHRADRAARRLRDLLPARVTVVRDGVPRVLDARDLVVGDLVILAAGDRVCSDLRVLEAHGLSVDTSTLTGESVPSPVDVDETVYAGTFVVEGEARAIATATGATTRLAGISQLTRANSRPRSPLARELSRLVRTIAVVAVGVGISFFGIASIIGLPLSEGFLFAIGVTVALVPEGLLPTVTLSLAVGAQRMAARRALVRRLESVETLGSTTFICTDKTGTLTRNEMEVVAVWTPRGMAWIHGNGYEPTATIDADPLVRALLPRIALTAARCSTGHAVQQDGRWVSEGDPMEAAIHAFAARVGVAKQDDERVRPTVRRLPFDPRRRRMSIVAGGELLVKGAPDSVLPRCGRNDNAQQAIDMMAERGLRVLAVASRDLPAVADGDADTLESGLRLLGLIGFEDPPRPGAEAAIAACRRAGIRIAMVTGDHPATARAIAREVGLLGPDELVLQGCELPADESQLGALIDRDGVVISRVAPEDKLRIARALRARGHVVAMTGDGVNDGPALQTADIGIAMGRGGTDVAREASDLVLLDDNFATIVAAIEQGRATFSNIRRFLTYHLTDNVGELTPFVVWALSGGQVPLALGVLQILCLDVGTDQLPALALGTEPPDRRALSGPPRRQHLIDRALLTRVFGVLGPAQALIEMAAFFTSLVALGWRPGAPISPETLLAASGAAFSAVVIGQAANAFACRSTVLWPGALGWRTNRWLVWAVVAQLGMLAGFLFVPPVATVLGHAPPPLEGWIVAIATVPIMLLVDAAQKSWHRRRVD